MSLVKYDQNKPRMTLIPRIAKRAIATVMTYGANKYSLDGWKNCGPDELWRYRDALERHWDSYVDGEWFDPESKLPHLWHVATNAAFLIWLEDYYDVKPTEGDSSV